MEKPLKIESLDRNGAEKGKCDHPKSPEFEFWMVRNPSVPQHNILTADQLFSDGVLLPLDKLPEPYPQSESPADDDVDLVSSGPELTAVAVSEPATTRSRRWKDIFKKSETKSNSSKETTATKIDQKVELPMTDKKRERRTNSGSGGGQRSSASAELNINIWPFSRSRSAKTGSTRPKISTTGRKVSSAPCSRSNSGSESKTRKWPASPARGGGVHVGRSSPVWHARRGGSAAISRLSAGDRKSIKPGGGKAKKNGAIQEVAAVDGGDFGGCRGMGGGVSHEGSGVVSLFNFRSLFSRKVY